MHISIPCLAHDLQRSVELAAIAAANTRGRGNAKDCDRAATAAMRARLSKMLVRGVVINTEGELDGCDRSSMLEMDEKIGAGWLPEFVNDDIIEADLAADSLEGTELCAKNANNAMTTVALGPRGSIKRAPENYMYKLSLGPDCRGKVDPEAPIEDVLNQVARATNRDVDELNFYVLDRPRHTDLVRRIRQAGAEVTEIVHGDLTGCLLSSVGGSGVHGVVGIGGGPETFLAATADGILNGETFGRFVSKSELIDPNDAHVIPDDMAGRLRDAGFSNPGKFMATSEMVMPMDIAFAFSAVTNSELLRGVRKFKHGGRRVSSCLMIKQGEERIVRWCDVTETTDPHHVFSRDRD